MYYANNAVLATITSGTLPKPLGPRKRAAAAAHVSRSRSRTVAGRPCASGSPRSLL
jgi:hypothetical protein